MTDYRPIPCAVYSLYEIAILHHKPLRVRWRDMDGVTYMETLIPEDLITSDGEEFLLAHNAEGHCRRLRLDRLATIPAAGKILPG